MHIYNLTKWQHEHNFTHIDPSNERKTLRVVLLTASMMGLEIAAGMIFGSMALLADGWHMGTHAAALAITVFAYRYATRHARDPRYTFGTGKISVLGGFTSAVVLQIVAIIMMFEATRRLFAPQTIHFSEAIAVAVVGLIVNLVSVRLLGSDHHHHEHEHEHEEQHTHSEADHQHLEAEHDHPHPHEDHNLKAAYLHVLADALTSVLAIIALLAGSVFGWVWLDAVMGIVGGLVISRWAIGLLRETGQILLDGQADEQLVTQIRTRLENDADTRLCDLHVWKVGDNEAAAIISLVTHYPQPVEHYRELINSVPSLKHITVEINTCEDAPCLPVDLASVTS
jgi:cation diffusion facilitator family transporter